MISRPFKSFFEVATGLRTGPHQYQANLAEHERLPDILAVPTGCGKTAGAVLSWAWRRREHPEDHIRCGTPRRLVYCLPMRTLVEQVHEETTQWFARLGWLQRPEDYRPSWPDDEVPVFRLMGGEEAEEWEAWPEREAVLIGTQDMLLSRALNRGYAMKPQDWPIAFGLLNVDALWILDEVQLMGAGRTTSVQLHQFRRSHDLLPRQSLWMSATLGTSAQREQRWTQPAPQWMRTPEHGDQDVTVHGLGQADRKALSKVLTGTKRAERRNATVEDDLLPGQILHHASGGRLVLVMLNRVKRAQELLRRVDAIAGDPESRPDLLLLHSRLRPRERAAVIRRLWSTTPEAGRIVISTQVLEAGVDLDADVLVTEICPWPSLVQRLGRLNRRGQKTGIIEILDVPLEEPTNGWPNKRTDRERAEEEARIEAALPYAWSELQAALIRIDKLDGDASISAIEQVDQDDPYPVPVEGHVLRRHHLEDLFDTDPDLSGGHLDVSRYVRGDRMDLDIAVLWRELGNVEPEGAAPPHPDEICKVAIGTLRALGSDKTGWLLGLQRSRRRSGAWREVRLGDPGIRPGDTVMLDVGTGGYDDRLGWVGLDKSQPSTWVSNVSGRRAWVRADGAAPEVIDDHTEGWAGMEEDPRSCAPRWMSLSDHLSDAESQARQIAERLVPEMADKLATAGRWHDLGKAHPKWQEEIPGRTGERLLAKFPYVLRIKVCSANFSGVGGQVAPQLERLGAKRLPDVADDGEAVWLRWAIQERLASDQLERLRALPDVRYAAHKAFRPGLRHEVASALAYLAEEDADDLVAWLVMAHHGKVRMTPTPWNDQRMDDMAGVRPGDRVPASAMALVARDQACQLDPGLLLPSRAHPGWQGRAVALLEDHGPQFLAYLEALLRIADWRASR
jgi:CRISPR-associated endonuclease/helicase Cas3